ncbi:MAG: hypothetical protein CMH98_00915 [Oceanospirillaceae bacterium]|nr:hypothetical protein [Oceanospirillaceae bacterium]
MDETATTVSIFRYIIFQTVNMIRVRLFLYACFDTSPPHKKATMGTTPEGGEAAAVDVAAAAREVPARGAPTKTPQARLGGFSTFLFISAQKQIPPFHTPGPQKAPLEKSYLFRL